MMSMADMMLEQWERIRVVLQELDAYGGQVEAVKGPFKMICRQWLQANSCARAFEERVMEESPAVFQRCSRPQELLDAFMRYEREGWPVEWAKEELEKLEDGR